MGSHFRQKILVFKPVFKNNYLKQEKSRFCPPVIEVDDTEDTSQHPKDTESTLIKNVDQIEALKKDESEPAIENKAIEEITREECQPMIENKGGEQQTFLTVESEPQFRYSQTFATNNYLQIATTYQQ